MSVPPSITFVSGKMVEDPSSQTDSITLGQNESTELEYNFYLTSNSALDTTYCFRVTNAGTSLDNYGKVATITTVASANTCTYTSGNWAVACSDFCNITSNVGLGGNNISIIGTGITTITANITNWKNVHIEGTDTNNICTVRIFNGGGFKE